MAWRAIACAIDAPAPRQRAAFLALLRRAFEQGMGVVAMVPRGLLSDDALQPWAARIRVLDGARNPIESAAIPWQTLPRDALVEVFARLDITTPLPNPLPSEFGALLRQLDAADLCTQAVLIPTARPGDDLLGVEAQGGGVVLVDTDDPDSDLLGSLLLQLFAHGMRGDRPLLLVRPARLPVPPTLADCCIQVVLGRSSAAAATLTARPGHWVLTDARGELILEDDLTRTPSEIAASDHTALVMTLMGRAGEAVLPVSSPTESVNSLPGAAPIPALRPLEPPVVPLLGPPALPAERVQVAGQALALGQETEAILAPDGDGVAALEDWSATFADTIADLDPVVTGLPTLTPLIGGPQPAADPLPVADTFDWWTLTANVTATLNGSAGAAEHVASRHTAPGAAPDAADARAGALPALAPVAPPADRPPLAPSEAVPEDAGEPAPDPQADGQSDTGDAVGELHEDAAVLTDAPVTFAPLDEWDVQLGVGDLTLAVDAPMPDAGGGVDGGEELVASAGSAWELSDALVMPDEPQRPAASLWLRPARRRWTPRAASTQRVAGLASTAPDDAGQPRPAAQVGLGGDHSMVLGGSITDGDQHAALTMVSAQPADGDLGGASDAPAAQDVVAPGVSDGDEGLLVVATIDALPRTPAQDDVLAAPLPRLPAMAQPAESAAAPALDLRGGAAEHMELVLDALPDLPAIGAAAPAISTRNDAADAHAEDLNDPAHSLVSTVVPVGADPGPAEDLLPLPDPMDPAALSGARMWPDVDREAVTRAWRGGLSVPELVKQLQAEYVDVAPGDVRAVVRAIIHAALNEPAPSAPPGPSVAVSAPAQELPPASSERTAVDTTVPGSAAQDGGGAPRAARSPAQDQPSAPSATRRPVVPAVQGSDLPLPTPIGTLDPTANEDQIWAAWLAGMDLNGMITAISGFTPRSVPGQAARDRIHHVVVPRIVAELDVEAVVTRWLAHEPLGDADRAAYELLLQRMNRQGHPVTGTIRAKTEQRLWAVMAPRLAPAEEV